MNSRLAVRLARVKKATNVNLSQDFCPPLYIMVPIFSHCPSGAILLRTKAISSKHMRRLISISVNYMLGEQHISYTITVCT